MMRRSASLVLAAMIAALSLGSGYAQDAETPTPEVTTDLFDPAEVEVTPIAEVEAFTAPSAAHTDDPVIYAQDPPAVGRHAPAGQKCGAYDAPVRNENAVHSQEHGAVWITYQPDLPNAEVKAVDTLAEHRPVLVSPYPDLRDPIVASAWGAQLRLKAADDPRLGAFIERYAGNGPEAGANCDSGLETTLEDAG